eukprot:NODE_204_length_2700_cov_29.800233_g190_i0.p2 GENE.NODE_204_length_2700_cov_29.800233_g190_i0~~NODE_204_length_2700_cov_29.800233_g190_i0.p2  ORF type:complete len:246 (-),score=63.23 NODE_204_length_2700_cov_29.800233_g190_i0:1142-1879(-)
MVDEADPDSDGEADGLDDREELRVEVIDDKVRVGDSEMEGVSDDWVELKDNERLLDLLKVMVELVLKVVVPEPDRVREYELMDPLGDTDGVEVNVGDTEKVLDSDDEPLKLWLVLPLCVPVNVTRGVAVRVTVELVLALTEPEALDELDWDTVIESDEREVEIEWVREPDREKEEVAVSVGKRVADGVLVIDREFDTLALLLFEIDEEWLVQVELSERLSVLVALELVEYEDVPDGDSVQLRVVL